MKLVDRMPSSEDLAIIPARLLESSACEHTLLVVGYDKQFFVIVKISKFGLFVLDRIPEELSHVSNQKPHHLIRH